jgi:hypothetical protein
VSSGKEPAHGSVPGYQRGCRCERCQEAWRGYHSALRAHRRERRTEDADGNLVAPEHLAHGTESTYINHLCRCPECKAAHVRAKQDQARKRWRQ